MYSPEFRDEAARLVAETSRAIADVAGRGAAGVVMRDARAPFGPCRVVPRGCVQVCGCVPGWRARPWAKRAGRGRPRPLVRAVCGAWCCRVVMIAGVICPELSGQRICG